jgi:hypothetical protein
LIDCVAMRSVSSLVGIFVYLWGYFEGYEGSYSCTFLIVWDGWPHACLRILNIQYSEYSTVPPEVHTVSCHTSILNTVPGLVLRGVG